MKISLNWLNDFIELNLSDKEISDQLIQLGLESTFKNLGKSFSGIVLGKVIQCKPHPNADKLSVCLVDVGASDILEIVCGAHFVLCTMSPRMGDQAAAMSQFTFVSSRDSFCSFLKGTKNMIMQGIAWIQVANRANRSRLIVGMGQALQRKKPLASVWYHQRL